MKNLLYLLTVLSLISCSKPVPNDYVTLKGKVNNSKSNTLTILGRNFTREIELNDDGSFKDTLTVNDGFHGFNDGNQQSFIYLKNGYDLELNFDADDFPGSIAYDGQGSSTNNYLMRKLQFVRDERIDDYGAFFALEKSEFDAKIKDIKTRMDAMLTETEGLEQEVIDMELDANEKLIEFYNSNYEFEHSISRGQPSPQFTYPDVDGNQVSLNDFKGKFVYIDVWATWCGPCKREIPYLKELNEDYRGTNLAIVSLSIDKQEDKNKWLEMIRENDLKGVHVLADNALNSEFIQAYRISGIPRFILIDKEGRIIDADAPRPSDPNLKEVLNTLNL